MPHTRIPIREFMRKPKEVDMWVARFDLKRYQVIIISAISYLVSSLVYIGLLFLFTYVRDRRRSASS